MPTRPSIIRYALDVARVCATRSEDPYRQVGAVALDRHQRIIATAYNGLLPGVDYKTTWTRNERQLYMVHAEENLCSLFRRTEVVTVVITCQPCPRCLLLLAAHAVERIYYETLYHPKNEILQMEIQNLTATYSLKTWQIKERT